MKKKPEKQPELSAQHRESLALLADRVEFKSLLQLFRIEEHNIIIQSFKTNSSDPDLIRKKAWQEGRMYEIRKILKTFEAARKPSDEEEE